MYRDGTDAEEAGKKEVIMGFNPLANQGQGSQPLLLPLGKQPEMELKT